MDAPAPGPPPPKPGNPPGEPPANDGATLRNRSALSTPSTEVRASMSAAARSLRSVRPTPWYAAWNVRFWRGVRDRSRLLRCGTTARRDRAATGSRRTSIPASTARPLVACTRVVSTPTVVVLPAPLGPSSPNTSPWDTPKDSPSTALTSRFGYRLTSSTTSTARSVFVICALLLLVVDDQIDEELADHLLLGRIALGLGGLEGFPEVLADLAGTCPAGLGNDQPDHPAVGLVALTPDVPGLLQGVDHPGQGRRREETPLRQLRVGGPAGHALVEPAPDAPVEHRQDRRARGGQPVLGGHHPAEALAGDVTGEGDQPQQGTGFQSRPEFVLVHGQDANSLMVRYQINFRWLRLSACWWSRATTFPGTRSGPCSVRSSASPYGPATSAPASPPGCGRSAAARSRR